jgi:hypothetical protein
LFMAIALASAEYNFDKRPYMFVLRECVVQDDGSAPFFVGLYKEECDDVAAADRRLNTSYKRALSKIDRARQNQLRIEQRRWIVMTNDLCKLSSDGTVRDSDDAECFIREARSRTEYLRRGRFP